MGQPAGTVEKHRGRWSARYRYTDPLTGKRREIRRTAKTKGQATDLLAEIRREVDRNSNDVAGSLNLPTTMTFLDLAAHFEKHYAKPPRYVDGRKVAGMRSWKTARIHVDKLKRHLRDKKLRAIRYGDLRSLRSDLLDETNARGRSRSIVDVNRTLSVLRRMLNIAERECWVGKNPFKNGESLISLADERPRERILSGEEECRLLAAARESRNQNLEAIIVAALDTGCRLGELLHLSAGDVDLREQAITIREFHSKTMEARTVPITPRLAKLLRPLVIQRCPEELVFGIKNNVKRSFTAARKRAGLPDLRFHDLRHSAATHMIRGGMPLQEVGRILGHHEPATTYRYVNADKNTVDRAREALAKSRR